MSTYDMAALALVSLALISPAVAQAGTAARSPRAAVVAVMSDIDQRFICPEFLAAEAARAADLAAFTRALAAIMPRPTPAQMNRVRSMLMERHNCSPVVASEAPPTAPERPEPGQNVMVASAAAASTSDRN